MHQSRQTFRTPLAGLWLVAAYFCAPALAQDAPTSQAAAELPLQPEIRLNGYLNSASDPIWVQFVLQNTSMSPIELSVESTPQDGIGLPRRLIVGPSDAPALQITFADEKPVAVKESPPASAETPVQTTLRIAANGVVGARLDLRDIYHSVRYPGIYKLEWRPFGGKVGSATAVFRVEPHKDVIIVTDQGRMTFRLMYDAAPRNVENFLELVRDKFYDGKTIHRLIPGFAIQGGDPNGTGTGVRADGKLIAAEFHAAPFSAGTLAMARKPDDPNSASCQFFITLARAPELDNQYTVIGQSTDDETLRTLQQIAQLPTDRKDHPVQPLVIRSINLVDRDEPVAGRLGGK